VDCFFHHAVPSQTLCTACGKPICATCRSVQGDCPTCRFAARIDETAGRGGRLSGTVRAGRGPSPGRPAPALGAGSRALAALGYPFWPLALLGLIDPARSSFVRRNAWQALGFNAGMYGVAWLLTSIAAIPFIGIPAWPLLPFIVPVTLVTSVVYAIKTWHGEQVNVPFVSELVDHHRIQA
jgi:uncharacterized membrane protein